MITFDLETTNHSYGSALDDRNRVLMVAWKKDDEPVRIHVGSLHEAKDFLDAIYAEDVLAAHNAKFEMHWLMRAGLDVQRWHWHDTMLAERVLAGNRNWKLSLGEVAVRYGQDTKDPVIDSMMRAGVCPSEMPQRRLRARCVRDVRVTHAILQEQLADLTESRLLHLYRTRCNFTPVLADMERNGMTLDRERVLEEYRSTSLALTITHEQLDRITGGINLRSPDQLAKYLYEDLKFPERKNAKGKPLRNKPSKQFPDGRPKTDQHTMRWLATQATTQEQAIFLSLRREYGSLNADLTKNLEFFKGVVDERDCKFHAQFNQTIAATHRLTSSGMPIQFRQYDRPKSVQLQNSPRKFKRLYCAPKDPSGTKWYVVEVDAAQLEFRVAAFCGQDEQAMADIADPDFDAHCTSASVMNQIDYSEFLDGYRRGEPAFKTLRQEAKADTFKPLYGGTKGTESQERWYQEFQNRYSGLYSTQESWVAEVARTGKLRLPWCRFYWQAKYNRHGVLLDSATNRPVGPQVFNYPVQALATAEMMPLAITALHKRLRERKLRAKLVSTVHDSVIAYVPEDELEEFSDMARECFTSHLREQLKVFYGIDFNVPLGCGITAGLHWGEGVEKTFDEVEMQNG